MEALTLQVYFQLGQGLWLQSAKAVVPRGLVHQPTGPLQARVLVTEDPADVR